MMIAIWIFTLLGIGIWSLTCWGLHALLTIAPGRIHELKPMIEQIPYGEQIELWIPGWQTIVQFAIDMTQGMLASLAGAAPWLALAIWAIGVVVLLALAGVVSLAVVLIRHQMKPPLPSPPVMPSATR